MLAATCLAQESAQSQPAGTWQRKGLALHLENRFEEAIPAFHEALRLDPALWTSHLFLGIGLYRTNQFGAARSALEQADRLAPPGQQGRDDVDYWLGAVRIAMRDRLQGLQSLERLLARNPKHAEALELAVRTYTDLGSVLWNDVAERHFDTAAGRQVHGHALESEGNRPGAMQAFRESKALDPRRAGPGLAMGRLLLGEGRVDAAYPLLKAEHALANADPMSALYAGLAAIRLGRFAEAAPLLEFASGWAGKRGEAPLALAQVYLALKEPANAVRVARQATALDPSSQAAHELLLVGLTAAGDPAGRDEEQQRWLKREKTAGRIAVPQ